MLIDSDYFWDESLKNPFPQLIRGVGIFLLGGNRVISGTTCYLIRSTFVTKHILRGIEVVLKSN